MAIIRKNTFLYTFIVIIPTIIAIIIFRQYLDIQEKENIKKESATFGQTHQQYLETLINETTKSLDILSIITLDSLDNIKQINSLLIKMKKTDKRYGDLYFVDANGIIKTGSTTQFNNVKVDNTYIETCSTIKKTHVSNEKEQDPNDNNFFFICKPLLGEKDKIEGFLIVQLRLDYIQNVLELLTPQIAVKITGHQNRELLSINNELKDGEYELSIPFDDVPWTLHINHAQRSVTKHAKALINFSIVFLVFTHIIFLAVQYLKLKRETLEQKKEYDTQKLKMIGTLAATTAHEIKNPLTGIKGLVQLLSEKHSDVKDQMYFSVIQKEITRINEIVNEFLILGKPSAHQLEVVNINDVILDILPILESEASTRLSTFHVSLGHEPINVLCLKDQVKQVVLNIVKNSFEACDEGDTITIRLTSNNSNAIITVEDDGPGMLKSISKKAFDPFFTTKSYGTGLGLYICKKIISMYKGSISVHSKRDVGTTVKIILPLHENRGKE